MRWQSLVLGLCLLVGTAGELTAQRGAELLDHPALWEAFDTLYSEHVHDALWMEDSQPALDLIAATRAYIAYLVRSQGGDELLGAALRRLETGDADERRRAALVLQQFGEHAVPQEDLLRFAHSRDEFLWTLALLWDERLESRRPEGWDRRSEFLAGERAGPVLAELAPQLVERYTLVGEQREGWKQEYLEGHDAVFLPELARVWEHVPEDQRFLVDLDGDDVEECFFWGFVPDGWTDSNRVMVLARKTDDGWGIVWVRHGDSRWDLSDVAMADVDGDGEIEIMLQASLIGGWCWEEVTVVDREHLDEPYTLTSREALVLHHPDTGAVRFAVGEAYNTVGGGKLMYLSARIGSLYHVHALRPDGEVDVVGVNTPRDAW